MIYCLNGKIVKKTLDSVVVACGGVGYLAQCPTSVAAALPGAGAEATLYTVLNVTENDITLLGMPFTKRCSVRSDGKKVQEIVLHDENGPRPTDHLQSTTV